MSSSTTESLIYVVEHSTHDLRKLSKRLEKAKKHEVETVLRNIQKTGDTLSGAIAKLATIIEALPEEPEALSVTSPAEPKHNVAMLEVADLLQDAIENGFCADCGGVLSAPETTNNTQH